jgi:PEGA domain-containing protein
MRRLTIAGLLLLATLSFAQSGAVIPQGGAGHADKASCVLLKRMGPADQITSHLYSFGIRGKQFQYIEGKLPEGFPFHGRLTDHDVRNLQGRGAEVIVLNQNYTSEELKQARADCQGETGKTPLQENAKANPSPAQATATNSPATPAATAAGANELSISSTPPGADIEIDGNYVGSTPSTVGVASGQHQISVKKTGFKPWERKIAVSSGRVNVSAVLETERGSEK